MKVAHVLSTVAAVAVIPLLLQACAADDGATTREAGSVVIIGPPPPGGGGSVSAVGGGCTTKGATTKVPIASVTFDMDESSITPPAQDVAAGVNRIVIKNFGAEPHEFIITTAASIDDLPLLDGGVDVDNLPDKVFRVAEFPGNTICEGTFDLPAGHYVAFSNRVSDAGTDFELGVVTTFTVS